LKISFYILIVFFLITLLDAKVDINSNDTKILNKCLYSLDDKNIAPSCFSKIQTDDLNFGILNSKKLTIKCEIVAIY